MKKIFYALFAAALMISCSETNVEEGGWNADQAQSAIEFFADDADSRTTYFEGEGLSVYWEEGDVVPIIARGFYDKEGVSTETRTRYYYKAETAGAATKFVPNTNSVFSWETELTNTGLKLSEQPVDFVSFYCNPTSSSTTIYNGIKVTSDYLQKQAKANDHSHIADYMVMASNMVHREAGDQTPIGFKYTNMMAIVELTLKGDASKSVVGIDLYSNADAVAFESAYLCVEDFTTTADVVEVPYTLYPSEGNKNNSGVLHSTLNLSLSEAAPLSAEGTKFYMVVMPGVHNDGDITLTVHCADGTYSTVEMGGITFEKNKVYKPAITLTNFAKKQAADIKHIFTDGYEEPVDFVNGAAVIADRPTYTLEQVPAFAQGYQVGSINATTYPSVNKIEAVTNGYVYVLVGASGNNTATTADLARDFFFANGWRNVTDVPTAKVEAQPESPTAIYYWNSDPEKLNGWAVVTLYERYMTAGESFDLSTYAPTTVKNFQGIRPVAKSIANEVNKNKVVKLDFTKQPTGWKKYTSFSSVQKGPIQGKQDYVVSDSEIYTLDFSYTAYDSNNTSSGGGSGWYSSDGTYLMMYIRYSTAESIGLPAIEGYKLVAVKGLTYGNAKVKPTFGISTVAAPADAQYVSNTFECLPSVDNEFELTIQNPQANTSYYFYATDKISSNHDARIQSLTLSYEPVE